MDKAFLQFIHEPMLLNTSLAPLHLYSRDLVDTHLNGIMSQHHSLHPVLSHLSPVYTLSPCLKSINITPPSMPRSPSSCFPSGSETKMLYAFMAFACVLHAPFTQNAQPISFRFNYLVITSITIQWTNHKADRTGNSPNLIYFQASRTLLLTIKLPEVLKQHGT